MTTYVHDGVEVSLTGRSAIKQTASKSVRKPNARVNTIVEITPVDGSLGGWKKWVKHDELYKIAT